ncbi:MAG: D-alanyl-D-alanine carboxypeptidase/D-alanyl-D-alanine-endopeptidase [Parachlamydiaceae bacterium]|nr:D-alanyl-D-alanine carboxypeptidase/D-alanyl-D-alanine-endopeptidase [Parachlamydiaceae bacterium]
MKIYQTILFCFLSILLAFSALHAKEKTLPEAILKIIHQPKYEHSTWALYAKDIQTGEVFVDTNSNKLFSPASTTKLFSVAALINAYGDDYRFKTPVYALGDLQNGQLQGNLVLVAQGDLTMGGREGDSDKIAYTKLDHLYANNIPSVILTKENPLHGINALAAQIYQKGIKEIKGDVLIDTTLFDTTEERGVSISPIFLNENLIDIIINPSSIGQIAALSWRPKVPGYEITNQVKTVAKDEALNFEVSSDITGHKILVKGSIPIDQKDVVRTFSVKNASEFARAAFIQALQEQGIKINLPEEKASPAALLSPLSESYKNLHPVALWTSPPLSEYAKLILKVSHNIGANLIPFLLAIKEDKKSYDDGVRMIGKFLQNEVKLSPDSFVIIDAAGGNENRFTPIAEVQLLEFMHKKSSKQFQHFYDALPILGVDGNLEDFGKNTNAVGKVRAKPGTGISYNLATDKFFLITQAFGGYIERKNGDLIAYMLAVENGKMDTIQDVFSFFEDEAQISSIIYNMSENINKTLD